MALKAIIWDVDGTLYEQAPLRAAVLRTLAREYWRHPLEGWRVARTLVAYRDALERLRHAPAGEYSIEAQIGLACTLAGRCSAEVKSCLAKWFEEVPLRLLPGYIRPGLKAVLENLRSRQIRLAVFSDYDAAKKLEALNLSGLFALHCCSGDPLVAALKPDPRGLNLVLDRLGVAPGDAMYVGDRPFVDAVAAQRAGMQAVVFGKANRRHASGWLEVVAARDLYRLVA
jgi:putative hydrolase of the HAD superfamily